MNYNKIKGEKYDIFLMNNPKFHDIEIHVNFTEPVTKRKITTRNFLASLLTYSCQKYDTTTKLLQKCRDKYSLCPKCSINRYGNILRTKFSLSVMDSMYINQDNLVDNIELMSEIILQPNVIEGMLKSNYYALVKQELSSETITLKEDGRLYANVKAIEQLSETENYALTGFSDLEILEDIDEKIIYESYQELLRDSHIDIIIIGKITNQEKIVQAIKKYFVFPTNKPSKINTSFFNHHCENSELKITKEKKNACQSKLSLVGKVCDINSKEYQVVLGVFNLFLGATGSSLLMKNVREKNNLCYYINSFYNKLDGIMIINSGINKENFEKVVELIQKTMDNAGNGKFSIKELNNVKAEYINELERVYDSNNSIGEYIYGKEIFNSSDLEEKIQLVRNLTKEDICNVAKKIKIISGYFLEGDQ